jgi:hypothetical protein
VATGIPVTDESCDPWHSKQVWEDSNLPTATPEAVFSPHPESMNRSSDIMMASVKSVKNRISVP